MPYKGDLQIGQTRSELRRVIFIRLRRPLILLLLLMLLLPVVRMSAQSSIVEGAYIIACIRA